MGKDIDDLTEEDIREYAKKYYNKDEHTPEWIEMFERNFVEGFWIGAKREEDRINASIKEFNMEEEAKKLMKD
jgi:hypothetical protein